MLCISCFKDFHPQSWPSSHTFTCLYTVNVMIIAVLNFIILMYFAHKFFFVLVCSCNDLHCWYVMLEQIVCYCTVHDHTRDRIVYLTHHGFLLGIRTSEPSHTVYTMLKKRMEPVHYETIDTTNFQ